MAFPGSTASSLLLRAQANEPRAWEQLVALYGPLVYAWIRQAGISEGEAVDVGQEVFLAVVRGLPRFDPGREGATFRGWLRVIATSKVNDYFRDRARQPRPAPVGEPWAVAADGAEGSGADLLPRLLAWLEPQYQPATWQAFWRTVVEDRPAPEVAAALGLTAAAVRQAKARILRRLREELAGLGQTGVTPPRS